jgi:hypothetical protein
MTSISFFVCVMLVAMCFTFTTDCVVHWYFHRQIVSFLRTVLIGFLQASSDLQVLSSLNVLKLGPSVQQVEVIAGVLVSIHCTSDMMVV